MPCCCFVTQVDTVLLPKEENPWGGAFVKQETDLENEREAGRVVDSTKARFWKIKNPAKKHVYSGVLLHETLFLTVIVNVCLNVLRDRCMIADAQQSWICMCIWQLGCDCLQLLPCIFFQSIFCSSSKGF